MAVDDVVQIVKNKLNNEFKKIWNKLKEQPEKGFVVVVSEHYDNKEESGAPPPSFRNIKEHNPKLEKFQSDHMAEYNAWILNSDNEGKSWVTFISALKQKYALGPSVSSDTRPYQKKNIGGEQQWWKKSKTHLSKDGKYYIVPLVYENMMNNTALVGYKEDGKYSIGESGTDTHPGKGLLGNNKFSNDSKMLALKKLESDLNKAIGNEKVEALAKEYGIIPKNIKVDRAKGAPAKATQSWHIIPRKQNYQNLWIKVMFDKEWVDSLAPSVNPNIDYTITNREVLILVKDLKGDLDNLEKLLYHFDIQIGGAQKGGIQTSFDPVCTAGKIKKIYGILDDLMRGNGKESLKSLEKTNAAFQFGFTNEYVLQYIAYSEVADCLCDKNANMNAYVLKEGLEQIKAKPPFSSSTINNFIHLLPDINRRYKKYLKSSSGKIDSDLFSTQQSWLSFVQTYVYPPPEVAYQNSGTLYDDLAGVAMGIGDIATNPLFKDLLYSGKYIKDPLQLLSPDVKNLVVGASNTSNMYYGDDALLFSLKDELKSMTSLYDKLLHKVPVSELIKVAAGIIFKCLPLDDLKRHLCKIILKTIPIAELRVVLYPCLRELGAEGEMAIAKLEGMVTGRTGEVYAIAKARYPDKFPADAADAAALAEMTSLYCSDPHMQKKLGRSPDDFNDELAAWADQQADDAICDCILTLYGPITELLAFAEEVYEDVIDGLVSASKTKPANIEKEATMALEKMIAPIKNWLKSRSQMGDFGAMFLQGLQDMAMNLIYAAVMIVLKYVRDEILGSLTADLCNMSKGSPFNFTNPVDFIMNSSVYHDDGQQQIWDKFKDFDAKHFFNMDIQSLVGSFEKLGDIFSPREIKRLFTTSCDDNSFDDGYAQAIAAFITPQAKQTIQQAFPGQSMADIASKAGSDPDLPWFPSVGQVHDLILDVSTLIDPNKFDEAIEKYDIFKKRFVDFCAPGGGLDELADTVSEDDIKALAEGDTERLLQDITKMLPLLDEKMMEDMFPPIFCGPCAPKQVGMQPLMPSQTHPTQLFMFDRLNQESYKIIDEVFNNNLSVFKPIIKEVGDVGLAFQNDLVDALPDFDAGGEAAINAYGAAIANLLDNSESDSKTETSGLIAAAFRNIIATMTDDSIYKDQMNMFDPENKRAIFHYPIPETSIEIYLIFNFSGEDYQLPIGKFGTNSGGGGAKTVPSPQIKLLAYNTNILEYEWPPEDELLVDFNIDEVPAELMKYFTENAHASSALDATLAIAGYDPGGAEKDSTIEAIFKGIFPLASSYILETVWRNATHSELFSVTAFNALPLTNAEIKSKCTNSDSAIPLLDPDKVRGDVDNTRKVLECVVSAFATPDALQIANIYGLYTLMLKVCIVEEYLKNIFMFGFCKISTIIENSAYMNLVIQNVRQTLESATPTGFDEILDYSSKIVNGRMQLGEIDDADLPKTLTGDACLKVLIKEVALEIDAILDTRVRDFVDPTWSDKFVELQDINENDPDSYFKNRFFEYAMVPDLLEQPRFPLRQYAKGGTKNADSYELHDKPFPAFANALFGTTALGNTKPFPEDWHGGLFYEPYIRMNSTLADIKDLEASLDPDAPSDVVALGNKMLPQFWKKFQEAVDYYNEFWFMKPDELKANSHVNPAGQIVLEWESKPPTDSWHIKKYGDYSRPYVYSKNNYPKGSFPMQSIPTIGDTGWKSNEMRNYNKYRVFLKKIITKINNEGKWNSETSTFDAPQHLPEFWSFFQIFFATLDGSGLPWETTAADQSYGCRSGANYRSVFERVVSSFVHSAEDDALFGPPQDGDAFAPAAGGKGMWDGFYYWNSYPFGVVPSAKHHFRNRGIISLSDASLFGGLQPEDDLHALSSYDYYRYSTISLLGHSKEQSIGQETSWNIDTEQYETEVNKGNYANKGYLTKILSLMEKNDYVMILADDVNASESDAYAAAQATETFEYDADGKLIGAEGFVTDHMAQQQSSGAAARNFAAAAGFYEWMKSIIVDSPYDLWFDMSIGMRINLIVPVDESTTNNKQFLKEKLDLITWEGTGLTADKNYNLDKAFLFASPGSGGLPIGDLTKWLCLPLEYVEYDLLDYWKQIYNEYGPTTTAPWPIFPLYSSPHFKSPANETANNKSGNPWDIIMKDIGNLGARAHQFSKKYRFHFGEAHSAGGQPGTFKHNIYSPTEYNQHVVTSKKTGESSPYISGATPTNFERPRLWSVCKLINSNLALKEYWGSGTEDFAPNPVRKAIIDQLKNNLHNKMKKNTSTLMQEMLPIKESVFTTALIYRYAMEASYPSLTNMFEPTKLIINSFIIQMLKTLEGDYSYVNELTKNADAETKLDSSSPTTGDIAMQFLQLIVQGAANTVDPTWKSPWFMPGPLTPVGIIAKLMAGIDMSDDKEGSKKDSITEGECEDPPGYNNETSPSAE